MSLTARPPPPATTSEPSRWPSPAPPDGVRREPREIHGETSRPSGSADRWRKAARRSQSPGSGRRTRRRFLGSYGCGALRFAGAPDALYERHLKFDNVVEPDVRRRSASATRRPAGRCATSSPTAGCAPTRPTARESEAGLLHLDRVPDRPLARQQRHEPDARSGRVEDLRRARAVLDGAPRPGAGRGPGQRRPRTARGLLPRLDGDDGAAGDGLRPALRARHLPAGAPQRLAGGEARQLAQAPRSLGGGAPGSKASRSSSAARWSCGTERCASCRTSPRR